LRRAFECEELNPYYLSFLGLSVARAERKSDQALEFCEIAVQLKRQEALAEVYQLAARRTQVIDTLDAALEVSQVLFFLDRDAVLNRLARQVAASRIEVRQQRERVIR
jgi:hypothetical protein